MKNLLLITIALFTFNAFSQTIVDTSPQNKKVVLEEFTGIHCVFCPQGHAIAESIKAAHPDDVFLVNIHVGGYAVPNAGQPDFRTPFGSAIANQSNLAGYPAGTVNRHFFPGSTQNGGSAQNRSTWASTANQTLTQASYVNVGVESEIDILNNEITVHVEAYYTGNSPSSTNVVNIALLQDNTLGPQTGGGAGNNYNHSHRLVHLITGQWGATINNTTTGSFYDETFTYTIPADYHGVPTEITDMKIVAYVTEDHQEVLSGAESLPTFANLNHANNASINEVIQIENTCASSINPQVNIKNLGTDEITSLAIDYTLNSGTTETYNWTGSIMSLRQKTIDLPEMVVTLLAANTLDVSIPNDEDNTDNTATMNFNSAPIAVDNTIKIQIQTNSQGSQNYWYMRDGDGNIFAAGSGYGNNEISNEEFEYAPDCYTMEYHDTGMNGGSAVTVSDGDDTVLFTIAGNFGEVINESFGVETPLGLEDDLLAKIAVYPNPVNNKFTVSNAAGFDITLYSILGKEMMSKKNISENEIISTNNIAKGTYFLRIASENSSKTEKIVIIK